jgi:5-methylcytosine-specific restriction protein A
MHLRPAWVKRRDVPKRITGRRLQKARKALFERDPLCRKCAELGFVTMAQERDHVVPLAEGGADDEGNTQGLCTEHNREKGLAEALRGRLRARG